MREIVREDRERPDSKSGTKHHLALALSAFFLGGVFFLRGILLGTLNLLGVPAVW
jgi:hypothetical protein